MKMEVQSLKNQLAKCSISESDIVRGLKLEINNLMQDKERMKL